MATSGVIVVLGSPNDEQGRLLSIALERCTQAFTEYERNPKFAVLTTGGWGEHFNNTDRPHGFYVQQELMARGVPESAFLPCAESTNTIEDAALARPILDLYPEAELIVVTSDFHAERAKYLFEGEFPERRITIATSTTDLPPDKLVQLRAHEHKALQKLKNQSI